ncbi:MAG: hypothetical protein ACKVU4_05130 [Phycisphaerales bacterium]
MTRRHAASLAAILASTAGGAHAQIAQDHTFTYQGRLTDGGGPATGDYDLQFTAFDAATGGTQFGPTVEVEDVTVTDGVFTAGVNFGAGLFTGQKFWLEVGVRDGASIDPYTTLDTRSEIASAPYASCSLFPWELGTGQISYTGGRVGVGTASPLTPFTLQTSTDDFGFSHTDGTRTLATFVGGLGNGAYLGTSSNHPLYFYTNDSGPLMTIATNGNVGVGTSNPGYRLHVVGASGQAFPLVSELHSTGPGNAIRGVVGPTASGNFTSGVTGVNSAPAIGGAAFGMYAEHASNGVGIRAISATGRGVEGVATNAAGYGGYFANLGVGGVALWADGTARVKILHITGGGDLAEPFAVVGTPDAGPIPGMVVTIDEENPGGLRVADLAYDARVAGVISGANGLAAGMVLTPEGKLVSGDHPVALTGRVWCYADAAFGAIKPGDRLTTSATAGHAMRAADSARADGAVIGKAMTGLSEGRGLVLVLVNLQ